jgi:hypothetical protein
MKTVLYPGPAVASEVGNEPTLHPEAGLLRPGRNELPDALAERLIACELVAPLLATLPPADGATPEPAPRRRTATTSTLPASAPGKKGE